ncbi:MAG: cytochrome b/b6 domain-containing protein [Sulfurimonas sp.]|uniref:cytochrome b/b6 domain-containing protein n=1 Tax=Sulfurimonas sp. TaxID=2022749 RepID=UPI0025D87823|nr:cytochrome b/b6 domain-containing protein [Sulfurimonas sp.]MCK9490675.1 cytochrome b/b6 domain-containing protein [Sulfurimonas sp.]
MKYSTSFRIWHWLNAIVILGLIGTVLLRKTFLSWRTNSELIMLELSKIDISITSEQAKVIAKAIRSGMWEWHYILGYALVALVFFRIYLYFKDNSKKESFSSLDMHKKAVRISYYIVYATILFMALSGFTMYFYESLGLAKETAHSIKEIHELVYNILLYFVPLHIIGVFVAENRDEKGIVSTMINGKS